MKLTTADSLSIDGGKVFLNGEEIFSIPVEHHMVWVAGFWEATEDKTIYVGSHHCCHGHLYTLRNSSGRYILCDIVTLDTNLTDILPVTGKKAGFPKGEGVIVTGSGCDGSGVRLVNPSSALFMDV